MKTAILLLLIFIASWCVGFTVSAVFMRFAG